MPGLGPKRQGRHSPGSKAPYILTPERMRTFVVPTTLNASTVSLVSPLRSYTRNQGGQRRAGEVRRLVPCPQKANSPVSSTQSRN